MKKEKLSATFFEFVTALAFLYFFQERIDIGIIEVGLGGRLDATNVLNPLVSIITEIGIEHTYYLGNSIEEIAKEKGGIIKPRGTVFISTESGAAVTAIKNITKEKRAICFQYGEDYIVDQNNTQSGKLPQPNGATAPVRKNFVKKTQFCEFVVPLSLPQTFSLEFQGCKLKKLEINTAGIYQIKNSSTAVAVALYLKEKYKAINENPICEGLKNTKIPCRMELVRKSPQIVMDTAHNLPAIRVLNENIPLFFTYKRLIILLGMLGDKDYKEIIKILSSEANIFIMTEPKSERVLAAGLLEQEALSFQKETFVEKEIPKAIRKIREIANPDDLILVTGSFYTVGEALLELSQIL